MSNLIVKKGTITALVNPNTENNGSSDQSRSVLRSKLLRVFEKSTTINPVMVLNGCCIKSAQTKE